MRTRNLIFGALLIGMAPQLAPQPASWWGHVSDEATEESAEAWIKTRLAVADDMPSKKISVHVENSTAYLSGHVDKASQADRAARIAGEAAGVHHVVSYLTYPVT
jgi:osmotically-inducible protein OsmY